jgi:hypothetical protein
MEAFQDMGMWLQCVLVGAVWGFTNALMRLADTNYTKMEGNALKTLLLNWRWVLAFLANQSGSVLFYYTLRDSDLSLAVPVCQATTLMFNLIGAKVLGERFEGDPFSELLFTSSLLLLPKQRLTMLFTETGLGVILISCGVALMRPE